MAEISKHILKNGEKRWRVRFYVRRDSETGKRRIITKTFHRKKDADAFVARMTTQKTMGGVVTPSKQPLGPFLTDWLEQEKRHQLRPRTFKDYQGAIQRYIIEPPAGVTNLGEIPMNQLNWEVVRSFYSDLMAKGGLSPRTVRGVHAVLRQGLQRAVRVGALASNPTELVQLPKQQKREVTAMSQEEAAKFLEAAREDRYYPLWCVLLTGGLRPSEAMGLQWPDVDWDAGTVRVQRALSRHGENEEPKKWALRSPKTKNAIRPVALPDFAVRALREWKTKQHQERLLLGAGYQNDGFIFATPDGAPLEIVNLNSRNFRRIMESAGLGEWEEEPRRTFRPKYRMYDLRHTCATNLLRAGVHPKVVSERLGHATVAFTLDVYSAAVPDMQSQAAEEMERMFGGNPTLVSNSA